MRAFLLALAALGALTAAPAMAQRADRNVDLPVVRSFHWFDFVGANDIRAACVPGGRSHLRLVYNALWEEQVRVYDIYLQPDGVAGLNIGVLEGQGYTTPGITNMLISNPRDIFAPWSMKGGQRILTVDETRELLGLLEESRAFGPPRDGMRLPDNDFWWTVASCRNGVWIPSLSLSDRRLRQREVLGPAVLVGQGADTGQSAPQAGARGTSPRLERSASARPRRPLDAGGGKGWSAAEVAESVTLPI
jgi:hypothetical protein